MVGLLAPTCDAVLLGDHQDRPDYPPSTLARLVDMTSAGPARLFGVAGKGRIAAGYDADLTIVDLKRRWTITDGWIASRCGWTPYDGVSVTGRPVGTIVRGERVMWDGEVVAPSLGRAVRFLETLERGG